MTTVSFNDLKPYEDSNFTYKYPNREIVIDLGTLTAASSDTARFDNGTYENVNGSVMKITKNRTAPPVKTPLLNSNGKDIGPNDAVFTLVTGGGGRRSKTRRIKDLRERQIAVVVNIVYTLKCK